MKKHLFTKHGYKRLKERTNLDVWNISQIFKQKQYITIGKEKNREHRLLYSIKDKQYLVIIYDVKTKEVITVLYPDYHEKCAFAISPESLKKSYNIATGRKPSKKQSKNEKPKGYKVIAKFQAKDNNNYIMRKNLGIFSFDKYKSVQELIQSKEIADIVKAGINQNEIEQLQIYKGRQLVYEENTIRYNIK